MRRAVDVYGVVAGPACVRSHAELCCVDSRLAASEHFDRLMNESERRPSVPVSCLA